MSTSGAPAAASAALAYLESHALRSVFEALTVALLVRKPEDPLLAMAAALESVSRSPPSSHARLAASTNPDSYIRIMDSMASQVPQPNPQPQDPGSDPAAAAAAAATSATAAVTDAEVQTLGDSIGDDVWAGKSTGGLTYMEDDALAVVSRSPKSFPFVHLVGVFDGHSGDRKAGRAAAALAKQLAVGAFLRSATSSARRSEVALDADGLFVDMFDGVQRAMVKRLKRKVEFAGTTATVAVTLESGELIVANVGDSAGLLCTFWMDERGRQVAAAATRLTVDHVASDADEAARAIHAGAFATDDARFGVRINGLQVTRSLGDVGSPGTICTPHVTRVPLGDAAALGIAPTPQGAVSMVQLVVVCSDGVWGALTDQTLVEEVLDPAKSAEDNGQAVLMAAGEAAARSDGAIHRDNLSVAVIRVQSPVAAAATTAATTAATAPEGEQ